MLKFSNKKDNNGNIRREIKINNNNKVSSPRDNRSSGLRPKAHSTMRGMSKRDLSLRLKREFLRKVNKNKPSH